MVELLLTRALRGYLSEVAQTIGAMPGQDELLRTPVVIDGYLPPKREDVDVDMAPQIIVRLDGATTEREAIEATVTIIVCCYSKATDGYANCLSIIERIRTALLKLPAQTLDYRYQLRFPIEWNNVDEQPYPQWQMSMTTRWVFYTPQIEDQF